MNEASESLEGIAIIGLSGRFPGAKNITEFWQNIAAKRECISFFDERELRESGIDPNGRTNPNYVPARGILEDAELFDAEFFGFSAREAEITDPQHRLFLEQAWLALENSGYSPESYNGRIGIYGGSSGMSPYFDKNIRDNRAWRELSGDYLLAIANDKDFLATRVAYKLNLTGPALTIQTACSTSLVATSLACQSLLNYQCDMALAGGVSLAVPQKAGYLYLEGMILSPDGHCRAFDQNARGTVPGNGVGIVVLKRLEDAIADGDWIHAVIKGSAINNDGSLKVGYTAPSIEGQAEVIAEAIALAEVEPETISLIEAHGTGTQLGDPCEIAALTSVFRETTDKKEFCAIGSVKTNIGHLDSAAGIAGLIKTALALEHKLLPPSLHFSQPNPQIDFANSPFYVNTETRQWNAGETPRRAQVSSFGVGGTNAHMVLEEAPERESSDPGKRALQLLLLSAKTEPALERACLNLSEHLNNNPQINLADAAYTLAMGRSSFNYRRVVCCSSKEDAYRKLVDGDASKESFCFLNDRPVAFLFPGQGSQYVNMGAFLYESEPVFREQIDLCSELLSPTLGLDLRSVLYPDLAPRSSLEHNSETSRIKNVFAPNTSARELLQDGAIAQPAIFAVEYAAAKLWMSWGVHPTATLGHSIGEYTAACLAGVFSLEDALSVLAARGRLMQEMPPGAMLAVFLPQDETRELLTEELSLATINGPSNCVVSGPVLAVEALQSRLEQHRAEYRRLEVSRAFHSQMMEPILERFARALEQYLLSPPQIPLISNVTGTWITQEVTDPKYWVAHLLQTVQFDSGLQQLLKQPDWLLLEVGPGRTLTSLARRHPHKAPEQIALNCLPRAQEAEEQCRVQVLTTLGQLWLSGVKIDWAGFYQGERRRRLPLPGYPFQGEVFWAEPQGMRWGESGEQRRSSHPSLSFSHPALLVKNPDIADWFYVPSWKRSPITKIKKQENEKYFWLAFSDSCGIAEPALAGLTREGHDVILVRAGAEFAKNSETQYTLNPAEPGDYDALLNSLPRIPERIVHLWSLTDTEFPAGRETLLDLGLYSLLFLGQALAKQNVAQPIQIDVVHNEVQDVTGSETLSPAKAPLLAPVLVLPQDLPNIATRSIDVELSENLKPAEKKQLAGMLEKELLQPATEKFVAYRGNRVRRLVQIFEPVPLFGRDNLKHNLKHNLKLRLGGVYLISGGLGNIGLTLGKYLAREFRAKLVLVGRSQIPPRSGEATRGDASPDRKLRALEAIEAMEELGAEVLTVSADVADRGEMEEAIAIAEESFGPINGVFHAAGLTRQDCFRPISSITKTDSDRQLRSKGGGVQVLSAIFSERNTNLDFAIAFSSLSTVLGGERFVGYAAANLFMDALCLDPTVTAGDIPWTAVNWDGWEFGSEKRSNISNHLALTPSEGMEAMARILSANLRRVVVSTGDLEARINQWAMVEGPMASPGKAKTGTAPVAHSRPNLTNTYRAPSSELERKLADIWQEFFSIASLGVDDDFFDLGGDSLLAVQLTASISSTFATAVTAHTLLNAPTIALLAAAINSTGSDCQTLLPTPMVEVQRGSSGLPLFLVHPAGGYVYFYRHHAAAMGKEQPVYGFQDVSLAGETQLYSVEDMAARYQTALREFQPEGPYFLGGSSFGGTIAFEMARQLHALGEEIPLLALIDSPMAGGMQSKLVGEADILAYLLLLGAGVSVNSEQLQEMTPEERSLYFAEHGAAAKSLLDPDNFRPFAQLFQSHMDALENYRPQTYPGRVVFFRAMERDPFTPSNPESGWHTVALGGLVVREVPGNHITMNFPPHVSYIADGLREYLQS